MLPEAIFIIILNSEDYLCVLARELAGDISVINSLRHKKISPVYSFHYVAELLIEVLFIGVESASMYADRYKVS